MTRSGARAGVGALLCTLAAAAVAGAQARQVDGQVVRPAGTGAAPVPRQWVVLHRVGSDRAAPLDSVRTSATGRFRFRFAATGSPDALYFVSSTYGGIAYFSPPLRSAAVSGGDADIMVYDTTHDTATLHVQGRHLVIAQSRDARRDIAEIFEIENQGMRTVTARDSVTPVWTTALPVQAESLAVAPGDVSATAVVFRPGRAELYAPLSPGVRQIVLTYVLPADAFPLSIPIQRPTGLLEVLAEEARAVVEGAGLVEGEPVPIEGRTFRRFLASDVAATAVVRLTAPLPARGNSAALRALLATFAVVMLGALALWFLQRRGSLAAGAAASAPPTPSSVDRLIAELAALDVTFEREGQRDAEAYRAHRAALKARIASALAAEQQQP
ncbi:MAG: hypothetical protein WD801_08045 [Gemmatimonadaceae bacterium]